MARRFQFRLETLLRVRQLREREAKRNVAAQRAEIARLDRLNEQTAEEIARQQEILLQGQQRGVLDPLTLQRGRAWIGHLRRTIAQRHVQRAEMVSRLRELQALWQAARTQARIIEKLRERRWTEYRRTRDRQEQAAADELAQQLHGYDLR
ncbi:MAG TPA: flagellar FliJ family protein [Phycisphaerae bacterium]|jgi:flagellar FliJ protein|nr:flagellar FliJ family protein [Phycisphaerae bacterium]HPM24737.1 flagellar FliJ family protein [Phycisphaerae bacterium]